MYQTSRVARGEHKCAEQANWEQTERVLGSRHTQQSFASYREAQNIPLVRDEGVESSPRHADHLADLRSERNIHPRALRHVHSGCGHDLQSHQVIYTSNSNAIVDA